MRIDTTPAEPLQNGAVSGTNLSANGVVWLAVPEWSSFDWLWHGFSTRTCGVSHAYQAEVETFQAVQAGLTPSGEMNLGFTAADTAENVCENRLRLIEAVTGHRETPLVTVRQVHSKLTVVVDGKGMDTDQGLGSGPVSSLDSGHDSGLLPQADGIMTNRRGLLIGIQTADCIPVLIADPEKRAVAAFHAGWRGTAQRIVELGVARMREQFGSDPANLVAAIGPGIGACCYTVGGEVLAQFEANFLYAKNLFTPHEHDVRLDLTEANRMQLLAAGLPADSIATVGGCTSCRPDLFYSHRASGGHAGRMMAVIGIRSTDEQAAPDSVRGTGSSF